MRRCVRNEIFVPTQLHQTLACMPNSSASVSAVNNLSVRSAVTTSATRPKAFGPLLILPTRIAVSVSLCMPADSLTTAQGPARGIGIADVNAALVEILSGNGPAIAMHSCWGAVIARHRENLVVLTAAHCFVPPSQETATSAYIKFQNAEISRPNQVFVHPRFNPSHRSANFDIATIATGSGDASRKTIPLAAKLLRPQPGEMVTVLNKSLLNGTVTWSEGPIAEVTTTSLTLAANAPLCLGSSGAPVLLGGIDGYTLVGVVSSGSNDCSHGIKVARVSSAIHGFLENVIKG